MKNACFSLFSTSTWCFHCFGHRKNIGTLKIPNRECLKLNVGKVESGIVFEIILDIYIEIPGEDGG